MTKTWRRRAIDVTTCQYAGVGFIVVLGEPDYYCRFGFLKASSIGLANEYGAGDAFMALELFPQAVVAGMVRYAPEFNDLRA
jgi:putative acetyltransferase